MLKKLSIGLAIAGVLVIGAFAYAGGVYTAYPQYGSTQNTNNPPGTNYSTTCLSFGNNGVCNQYQPYFFNQYLSGGETFFVDSNYPNQQPNGFTIPLSAMAGGFGSTTIATTTGTTAAVQASDGISNYIYAGSSTATYTSFKLPPNPMNNQQFCLVDAGSGVLTLTAVAAGTNLYGNTPTITGTTPTSLPVATAVGTAGTVTLSKNCWLYVAGASNTGVWYRTL